MPGPSGALSSSRSWRRRWAFASFCRSARQPRSRPDVVHQCIVHALDVADVLIGRAIERSLEAHHRYRLWRLGRLDALRPPDDGSPWCREAPPPRDGCSIDVLIDGEETLSAIAEAIRGARQSVRLAGWHTAPHFALERREPPTVLR